MQASEQKFFSSSFPIPNENAPKGTHAEVAVSNFSQYENVEMNSVPGPIVCREYSRDWVMV